MAEGVEVRPETTLVHRPGWSIGRVANTPWLSAAHLTLGPDAPREPLHVHHEHAESFFVLDGTIRLLLADGECELQSGSWVHLPAGVAHTQVPVGRVRILDFQGSAAPHAHNDGPSPSAIVVPPGSGETILNRLGRCSILLSETEDFAVTKFIYGPGEPGPDPHVHRQHAEAFLVLEGTLTISLRETALRASAETLIVVPPNVIHSYANESAAVTRILNFHAPSSGFGDYLRGRYPPFDQHTPPADGGANPAAVVATRIAAPAR